jgi:hypothetical protein
MARRKLQKTLADYLAIGVTPILIMLLVGSLVFFLQELFFQGQRFESRSRWILFWFVIGSVLTARIAVESGRAQASAYTAGLSIAVGLAIFKFVPDNPWVPLACLGIIWWCTDKLTWDCTLIDESEDASGEGLLQVAGVTDDAELPADEAPADSKNQSGPEAGDETTPTPNDDNDRVPLWKRMFVNSSEREGKPHSPGLWIVYISLVVLPVFGFGQAAIPSADTDSRDFAFRCLMVYVASGLGLLMLTSFLGLRRYLRQRNLQLPSAMAASWVGFGTTIAIGILVVCLLLPRPDGEYDVTDLIDRASESIQKASDVAFLDDDGDGDGDGERSGQADQDAKQGAAQNKDPNQKGKPGGKKGNNPDAEPGDEKGENGKGKKDGDDGDKKGENDKDSKPGDQQGGNKKQDGQQKSDDQNQNQDKDQQDKKDQQDQQSNDSNKGGNKQQPKDDQDQQAKDKQQDDDAQKQDPEEDQQAAKDQQENDEKEKREAGDGEEADSENESESGSESDSGSSKMTEVFKSIGTLFKFVVYGILICVGLFFLWKNWAAVCNFFARLWNELLSLFGRSPKDLAVDEASDQEDEPVAPVRPFSAFANPFRSGAANQVSTTELVRYTFEALQAWAYENDCGRSPSQTPMEFGKRLQNQELSFASEANEVSQLYARVAYASHHPTDSNIRTVEKLWRKLKA